ncbi:MAG: M48 family metalloprotease [Promethearchaeota archaeon]
MKRSIILTLGISSLIIITALYLLFGFIKLDSLSDILLDFGYIFLLGFTINEFIHWYKRGSRGEAFDLIILAYLFITVYIFTNDIMNSFIGALSLYLFFGIIELKEYEVLNKILIITLVTYNFIFFAGLINSYLKTINLIETDVIRDTAFSMSLWIMLILGFILFGRKYLVVFRFMSPQYLSLFLFLIAWLAVTFISRRFIDIKAWIYLILIATNWIIYFISGPILDLMLGIKRTNNPQLLQIVDEVKRKLNIKDKIKVGLGKYPILNAMAYGAWFDKRIAIISPTIDSFPEDELKGIVGHELNHTKGGFKGVPDTLTLTIISSIELVVFWIFKWPATMYDYTFNPESQPFPLWVFIIINILISIILYIFVRALEAYADLNTKKARLGYELGKGLYNLEGFYSSGREIGLDTMLLCDEKLKDYNKIANYADTAEYLYQNMMFPKRYILLSNLLNSHPPTFHRVVSLFTKDNNIINPLKESILPFSLLIKKNQLKFILKYHKNMHSFKDMANKKFKEMFKIENYADFLEKLEKKELYQQYLDKTILYIHKYQAEINLGIIKQIVFNNNVCEPISFKVLPLNMKKIEEISKNIDKKFLKKLKKLKLNKLNSNSKLNSHSKKAFNQKLLEEVRSSIKSSFENNNYNKDNQHNENQFNGRYHILNPLEYNISFLEFNGSYPISNNYIGKLTGLIIPPYPNKQSKAEALKSISKHDLSDKEINNYIKYYRKFSKNLKNNAYFLFEIDSIDSLKQNYVIKPLKKKLKFNLNNIKNSIGKKIYLIDKNTLKILKLRDFKENDNLKDSCLICEELSDQAISETPNSPSSSTIETSNNNFKNTVIKYILKDICVLKSDISCIIHNNNETREYEKNIFNHLKKNNIRVTIYLKKPINNQETGKIKYISYNPAKNKNKNEENSKEDDYIIIKNIYDHEIKIYVKTIEVIVFGEDTIVIQPKDKMSIGDKIIKRIQTRTSPESILFL